MPRSIVVPSVGVALAEAALCAGCETIFKLGPETCPVCAGRVWMPMARFFSDRPTTAVVPLADVLHHAGNGLTPARVYAQRLAEVLDERLGNRMLERVGATQARKIIASIDDTMQRLRRLGLPEDLEPSTDGAADDADSKNR